VKQHPRTRTLIAVAIAFIAASLSAQTNPQLTPAIAWPIVVRSPG
jgi:hypothetical protein